MRNTTKTVSPERIARVSKSEKVRPRMTRGWSEGRKRYRKVQEARRPARRTREKGLVRSEIARISETTA